MRSRPPRTVAVGTTPVNIRKTPSGNDVNALPVTYTVVSYPSGGGSVRFVPAANSVYADGEQVIPPDTEFTDPSQAINRYMCASAGSVDVLVVDFEA